MHKLAVRVYYEDTDAGGVVYHSRYLNFFERGRTEYLRQGGCNQSKLIQDLDLAFVVKKMSIDYCYPAKLDDDLVVETTVSEIRKASIIFEQVLMRDKICLCKAQVVVASVKLSQMKPIAIPPTIKQLFMN